MSTRYAAASLAVAVAVVAVPACGVRPVRDEPVVLDDVRDAYVVTGGSQRPASDGDKLAKDDIVRTRAGGTATLVVRDRRVVLGGETDVVVPDGATVELDGGALLVDRRRGPGVTVRIGDATIDDIGAGALRVEQSFSVLVAALSADARVRTVTGAELELAPLHQVSVPGRGIPRTALPLQLRRDAWERSVIPDVVADDERIADLARGLEGSGPSVIPATYRREATGIGRASDLVVADAIGRAAARDEPGRRSAASRARLLRAEGGSWGVVARLLGTTAVEVGSALAEVLRGVPATQGDPGTGAPTAPGTVAGESPRPGVTRSPAPGSPTRTPGEPSPTEPTVSPSSPTETPDPLDALLSAIPTPPLLPSLLS